MDAILVVNAGSSSVKFQIFGIEKAGALRRLIKGQLDGIGTRPRLSAAAGDKSSLIDKTYVPDKAAGLVTDGLTPKNVAAPFLNDFPYLGVPYSGFYNPR